MKRLLPLLLVLLLLAGCAGMQEEHTEPSANDTTTAPVGLYDPDSAVEAATAGAVRAYPLKQDQYLGLESMGSRLLLIADDGQLTALKGEDCQEAATLLAGMAVSVSGTGFDSDAQGAAYYLPETGEVVLVNPQLQELRRISLPEELLGEPVISLASDEIYFTVPGEIRALNIQTGISRLVRSHSYENLSLQKCHFGGTVLQCAADSANGKLYFSAQTGQLLREDATLVSLQTDGKLYLAHQLDGKVNRTVFGTISGTAMRLNVEGVVKNALAMGAALVDRADDTGLHLQLYDLNNGRRTAQVTLPGVDAPVSILTTDSHVWILSHSDGAPVLYRWDVKLSYMEEDTVYTGPAYTADAPDEAGLDSCQSRVVELNQKYGIRVHIWQDAVKNTGGQSLVAEYQVDTIRAMLDELEPLLALFPEKFLQKTVEAGWVHVCLVRSVGNGESYTQYWSGGDCYIAICDNVTEAFLQGVGLAIDSHVLGNSRDFDDWNLLNPADFSYGTVTEAYLAGEEQCFVDEASMKAPNADRSRIFAAAVAEGNGELFAAPAMQAKLLLLCQGIREAYSLEKSPDTYLWEQYLTEPIAYVK